MRSALVVIMAVSSVGALACGPDHDPQRLVASGQIVASDESTPRAGVAVDRYQLTFVVAGEVGDVAINRAFEETPDGSPIVTDADGRFEIRGEDLALSYTWERDELVCWDVCVAWVTYCEQVTEEICASVCTDLECWDDCATECWDEVVCDDYDCWVETYCDEACSEVCEEVSYDCDCHLETYEVCGDECIKTVEECEWVTRTYTSQASLEQIVSTQADLWSRHDDSGERRVTGQTLQARQEVECDGEGHCAPGNLWIQDDRFVLPIAD